MTQPPLKIGLICKLIFLFCFAFSTESFSQTTSKAPVAKHTADTQTKQTGITPPVNKRKTSKKRKSKKRKPPVTALKTIDFEPIDTLNLADNIIEYSKLYLGRPYRGGSKGPNGFDCSGFTHFVFKKFGYNLGASSGDQATEGERLSKEDVQTGDLIFFKGRNSRAARVGHVGIVIENYGNGDIRFIHSACSSGVSISHLSEPYYRSRYVGCNRILKETKETNDFTRQSVGMINYLSPNSPQNYLKLNTTQIPLRNEFRLFQ